MKGGEVLGDAYPRQQTDEVVSCLPNEVESEKTGKTANGCGWLVGWLVQGSGKGATSTTAADEWIFDRCVVCGEQAVEASNREKYSTRPCCSVCGRRLTNAEFFEPVLFRQMSLLVGPSYHESPA